MIFEPIVKSKDWEPGHFIQMRDLVNKLPELKKEEFLSLIEELEKIELEKEEK